MFPLVIFCLFLFPPLYQGSVCASGDKGKMAAKGRETGRKVLFHEDFDTLSSWKPLYFPKIEKHSIYRVMKKDGTSYLQAESAASASALVSETPFDVYRYPWLRFRILVRNVYKRGDAEKKSGDDYPFRIYVMFKYDPSRAGFWEKVKYKSARLIYGKYPPYASLNYIWANKRHEKTILTSTYTDRAKMVIIDYGKKDLGVWKEFQVNILNDYRRAFGKEPPRMAQLAIMNDSDNTGESSLFLMDFLEVADRPVKKEAKASDGK